MTAGTVRILEGLSAHTQLAPLPRALTGSRGTGQAGVPPDCPLSLCASLSPPPLADAEAECTDPQIPFLWTLSVLSPHPPYPGAGLCWRV